MTEPRMADLSDLGPDPERVFGGKAAGLARLLAHGARVPPGFAVEASACFDDWTEAARAAFRERASALLARGRIALRSSAIGEDGGARSFAGLFETVLGVSDLRAAEEAAARCIASGRSERVRAYAGDGPVLVGLVAQSLVEPRTAGVCFTRDPAGRDAAVVVEVVTGLGDVLVSGRAQPERWRVYRNGSGSWEARRDESGDLRAASASDVCEVAASACAFASAFGAPLDLEWARDAEGRLFWLQARPITAAVPPPAFEIERFFEGVDDGPVTVWANWNVREVLPDPFTPLAWDIWRESVLPTVSEPLFGIAPRSPLFPHVMPVDLVHGRIRWNMNALLALPLFGALLGRLLRVIDARAAVTTARLVATGVLRPRRLPGSKAGLALAMIAAGLRSSPGLLRGLFPRRVMRGLMAAGERAALRTEVDALTDGQLLDELQIFSSDALGPLNRGMQAVSLGVLFLGAAEAAFRKHPDARSRLASGIPGNPTTEISIGVDTLVEAARPVRALFQAGRSWPELRLALAGSADGRAWLSALEAFLVRFGQRCPGEFDITVPRWAEDPRMIVDLVRAGLEGPPDGETVARRLERLGRERRSAIEWAVGTSPLWQRPLLRLLADRVEAYMPLREAPKHAAMFFFQRVRLAALEAGSRLVSRDVLAKRDDVFFLRWSELRGLVEGAPPDPDLPASLAARRARFARWHGEAGPDFLRSDGVPVEAEDESSPEPGVLAGVGASHGRAIGLVRILRAPDPSLLQRGEVMVVEYADPGWTPLFPRAAAVVMDVGGVMCHAAVVARELGIPAVFGVKGATRTLRDGVRVEVNGAAGTVRVLS